MSELSTLARPYAEAVFRLAQNPGATSGTADLATWSERLANLAAIATDPDMARLIADPALSSERVATLMIDVAGSSDALGENGANFVRVLAANDRLTVLPEIAAQFETLKATAEGTLEAVITSALPLDQTQIDAIVAGLKAKFQRAVSVTVDVDASLIGGAVIAIGDQVIDGSIKGRLEKMAFALAA